MGTARAGARPATRVAVHRTRRRRRSAMRARHSQASDSSSPLAHRLEGLPDRCGCEGLFGELCDVQMPQCSLAACSGRPRKSLRQRLCCERRPGEGETSDLKPRPSRREPPNSRLTPTQSVPISAGAPTLSSSSPTMGVAKAPGIRAQPFCGDYVYHREALWGPDRLEGSSDEVC
jgi:hypothetical protein